MEENYWLRRARTPLTRRKILAGTSVAALGAGAILVGCGDDDDEGTTPGASATATSATQNSTPTPTTQVSDIKRGGQMKIVWETEPSGTLDPHKTAGGFSRPMQSSLYEGLLYKGAGQPVVGLLASEWEQPDDLSFTFTLRPGVKFHDDTELNADIAKWNIERTLGTGFINEGGYKGAGAGLTTIEAIDDLTLKFTFNKQKVDSLTAFYWLGQNSFGIVSREAAERLGDELDRNPVGTGPFKMNEWVSGTRMTLDKNPSYWGTDADGGALPYLDSQQFVDLPELNVALIALQNNEIQSVMVGPQEAQQVANDTNIELIRKLVPDLYIYLNHQKEPFNDVRLRKALSYAIRRDEVMEVAYLGQAEAFGGGYHPDGDWYDPDFVGQTYDPNIAKAALQEAGVPDGFTFEIAVLPRGPRKTAAELIQSQLKEVGINMEILQMESNDYVARGLRAGELQSIIAGGGTTGLNETPTTVFSLLGPGFAINPTPEAAQVGLDLFTKTQTQFDSEERYETFQELAQWFWLDFFGRVDVGREVKIAAQRAEWAGFEWYGTSPQGSWARAYQRA